MKSGTCRASKPRTAIVMSLRELVDSDTPGRRLSASPMVSRLKRRISSRPSQVASVSAPDSSGRMRWPSKVTVPSTKGSASATICASSVRPPRAKGSSTASNRNVRMPSAGVRSGLLAIIISILAAGWRNIHTYITIAKPVLDAVDMHQVAGRGAEPCSWRWRPAVAAPVAGRICTRDCVFAGRFGGLSARDASEATPAMAARDETSKHGMLPISYWRRYP